MAELVPGVVPDPADDSARCDQKPVEAPAKAVLAPTQDDAAASSSASRARSEVTLMTFNVEEYWHSFNTKFTLEGLAKALKEGKVAGPQEHSLGLREDVVKRLGLEQYAAAEQLFTHADILKALLPDGYGFFDVGTAESPAKFSELANAVAWKEDKFCPHKGEDSKAGTFVTPKGKKNPSGKSCYTSRSVACVELRAVESGSCNELEPFVVCSTHLLGGRFEDSLWAGDNAAGANERVSQVSAIQALLVTSGRFTEGVPSVICGDFNVMKKGFMDGPFAADCRTYVMGNTMLYTREQMEKDFVEVFLPYQLAVHAKLEAFGYTAAYGKDDNVAEMKTSKYGGCTDWIYVKGMDSQKDERVISCIVSGGREVTDHNAVMVTLSKI